MVDPTLVSRLDTPLKSFTNAIAPALNTVAGISASAKFSKGRVNPTLSAILATIFLGTEDIAFNNVSGLWLRTL